jgi:MFS family permease
MFAKNVTTPIIVLYYLLNGLNFAQIGILTAIYQLADAALEIYGGALTDIVGKKKVLLLYPLLRMMQMVVLFYSHSFLWFVSASLLYGISTGIGMGSQHAMLFDTLKRLGLLKDHKKYRGRMQFFAKTFNAISILAIPVLYTINIKTPFIIGFVFYIITFSIALFFEEPIAIKKVKNNIKVINQKIVAGFKETIISKKVILIIILQAIMLGFILVSFDYFQPLLKITGVPIALFGLVYAFARFFEGLGGEIVHRLEKVFSNKRLLILTILFLVISFIGFILGKYFLIIAAILLISMTDGFVDVITGDMLNHKISSVNRTTIISIGNFIQAIFTAILAYGIGWLANRVGVQSIFVYMLGSFVFLGIICISLIYKRKSLSLLVF